MTRDDAPPADRSGPARAVIEPRTPVPAPAPAATAIAPAPQVDARGLALGILAALATVFALSWAQAFVVPLMVGIVVAYTLSPLVSWLEAIRIHRVAGTMIVMAGVIGALVVGVYLLRGQMQTIVEQLPEAATKFAAGIERMQLGRPGNLQKMQDAATEVEKATAQAVGGAPAARQPATHVIVDKPKFRLGSFLWESSLGALGAVSEAAMVVFLIFFLLLGGDTFKRKLVRLTGPSLSKRKITVNILDDINRSIQKYMLMLLTTNLLVGLLSWAGIRLHRSRQRRRVGGRAPGCCTSSPTSAPAVTAARRAWRHSCSSSRSAMAMLVARRVACHRHARRNVRHDLDDGTDRKHELRGRVHLAALLGLAVGRVGNAAQHSDHRHREGRLGARRGTASDRRTAWGLDGRGDPRPFVEFSRRREIPN